MPFDHVVISPHHVLVYPLTQQATAPLGIHCSAEQLTLVCNTLIVLFRRRTNVRKQAALSMVDPSLTLDPARTSENVKAALSDSAVTGPAPPVPKEKLRLEHVFPR